VRNRNLIICYGTLAYALFLAAFSYAIAFVGNIVVPQTIDHGVPATVAQAVLIDVLLLGVFAAQHSVMARPFFKRWLGRLVPSSTVSQTWCPAIPLRGEAH
jgi:methanethiol S-methyltransferase